MLTLQVIVNASSGELLCEGYNSQHALGDPTEHGEINAIRVSPHSGWSSHSSSHSPGYPAVALADDRTA